MVIFIQNKLLTRALQNQTPFEAWFGFKPYYNFLTYMVKHDKLDERVKPRVFISYNTISKAYRIFQFQIENFLISRDVHFMEDEN
ncbi:hypothetical protein CR513_21324, partial [Mucuna pruriens]